MGLGCGDTACRLGVGLVDAGERVPCGRIQMLAGCRYLTVADAIGQERVPMNGRFGAVQSWLAAGQRAIAQWASQGP